MRMHRMRQNATSYDAERIIVCTVIGDKSER